MTRLGVVAALAVAVRASAHEIAVVGPADVATAWTGDPRIAVPLGVAAAAWAAGVARLWRASGVGHGITRGEATAGACGWLALAVALLSPLHALGGTLFAAHMAQHELLMVVAAPLVVVGRPFLAMLWCLPRTWRRPVARAGTTSWIERVRLGATTPVVAWAAHGAALALWHVPALFDATLASDAVHALQHASFFGTGALFWWAILRGRAGRAGYGAGALWVFATAVQTGALGALLTVARTPWYPAYGERAAVWGLGPLEDQQLGGLLMWIPGGLPYLAAGLVLVARWLGEAERRTLQRERRWRVVATVAMLLALAGCGNAREEAARALTGGDPARGAVAIRGYGCFTCHTVSGVRGARGLVGPPLDGIGDRAYIAGELPNTVPNMLRWLEHPHDVEPRTVMPDMNVTEADARDIAAYLYALP